VGRRVFSCCVLPKKNGGLDFSKPPSEIWKMSVEKRLPSSVFFLFCRWADCEKYEIEKADNRSS